MIFYIDDGIVQNEGAKQKTSSDGADDGVVRGR